LTAKIPTVGKVGLVICSDQAPGEGRGAVLVTGQLHWEANKIVITYMHRWSREVFYKDAKHALGFSDDQCRSETAIETHGYLVFCASSLLKLSVLSAPLSEHWDRHLNTSGVALRRQVRSVMEPLILACHRFLAGGRTPQHVFNLLCTSLPNISKILGMLTRNITRCQEGIAAVSFAGATAMCAKHACFPA
jgi:hypothetical protein